MTTEEAINELKNSQWLGTDNGIKIYPAIKIAISALEKQIQKKPREDDLGFYCPNCGAAVRSYHLQSSFALHYEVKMKVDHCACCGQAIDWSEE